MLLQAAFGLRRQHAFSLSLVELAESICAEPDGARRGALARGLEGINRQMLPAGKSHSRLFYVYV